MQLLLHHQAFSNNEGFSTVYLLIDGNYNHENNNVLVVMMMTRVIIKNSNGVLEVVVIIVMIVMMMMMKTDGDVEQESDLHVSAGCCTAARSGLQIYVLYIKLIECKMTVCVCVCVAGDDVSGGA